MTANEINAEIVERVCVETALGTPNTYSHFVPCADEYGMSARFGHGGCFEFKIYCALYGPTLQEIERYVAERANLSPAVVPMFKGGKVEWLAYSGTMITSVFARRGAERSTNLWSLD